MLITENPCGNDAAPVAIFDRKFITHDGAIWPVPRPAMKTPAACVERMAEDMPGILRFDDGIQPRIDRGDLRALGWTSRQIETHFTLALDAALAAGMLESRRG